MPDQDSISIKPPPMIGSYQLLQQLGLQFPHHLGAAGRFQVGELPLHLVEVCPQRFFHVPSGSAAPSRG